MTVENDGLPLGESAAYDPDRADLDPPGHIAEPPTDVLPLGAVVPSSGAPTEALNLANVVPPATPAPHGSVEGDLFDGLAEPVTDPRT